MFQDFNNNNYINFIHVFYIRKKIIFLYIRKINFVKSCTLLIKYNSIIP